jgi:type IV secretory pathway VirB4 component
VGGDYINFSYNSQNRINPFDLSLLTQYSEENELNLKIQSLFSMFKVIMGALSPTEEALLDRAINLAYRMKGITPDASTQKRTPPLMEDLYKSFIGMEEPLAISLADRIERFVKGSFTGIIDQPSNIQIKNQFTVFSVRDLEDSLKPIAIFLILDYIWTKMRRDLKKRILVVDEAWYLMRYPDSANFLYGVAKRARKYFLGLTTITQDVEDFLNTDFGKAIVTNSSIQILMKQSPAGVDKIAQVFYLSEGEKHLLLSANVGEGLFFAGNNHVAVRFVASPDEHKLITTKPSEILARQQAQSPAKNPPRLITETEKT